MVLCNHSGCNQTFSNRQSEREHYYAEHDGQRYVCSSCNKMYKRHGGYYGHIKSPECQQGHSILTYVSVERPSDFNKQQTTAQEDHGVHATKKRITMPIEKKTFQESFEDFVKKYKK